MNGAGRVVIVGAGLAGGTAAITLREEGFEGELVLLGAEARPPYHRPPLSKSYLRGEEPFQGQLLLPDAGWVARGIETRFGIRACALDAERHELTLEDGERLRYDRLLLATGGRNRALPVPGFDLEGVLQLRTVEDADRIRAAAKKGARAAVVGLGFIGCEVAASLRALGVEVTAIEGAATPLRRVLGEEVGSVLADVHRDHGVQLALGEQVAALEGAGRVERVVLRGGRTVDCDLVVAGVGIAPDLALPAAAGAAVGDGVLVDERCRTSLPDVWAAGDLASHPHPLFGRIRVEHWNNAYRQGQAAARSLLGRPESYGYLHTFWSEQYEHKLEYAGHAARWDRVVVRGSLERRRFLAFYLEGGVVRAVAGFDRGGDPEDEASQDDELRRLLPLIREARTVDPAWLADG